MTGFNMRATLAFNGLMHDFPFKEDIQNAITDAFAATIKWEVFVPKMYKQIFSNILQQTVSSIYSSETYSESSQISNVELCENIWQLSVLKHFPKKFHLRCLKGSSIREFPKAGHKRFSHRLTVVLSEESP